MLVCQEPDRHDDVIKWRHFPRYWPFVKGMHRSMETRRKQRIIFTFHEIIHGRSPPYLRYLLPPYNRERSTRAIRNSADLPIIHARLDVFYKSYVPQTVREWNTLSIDMRQIEEQESFKRAITKLNPSSNLLFYHGKSKFNIIHSGMRMGCCKLMPASCCWQPCLLVWESPWRSLSLFF